MVIGWPETGAIPSSNWTDPRAGPQPVPDPEREPSTRTTASLSARRQPRGRLGKTGVLDVDGLRVPFMESTIANGSDPGRLPC
ncbi:hypothetical protein GCM10010404_70290 [Nonomuraea africana]